jgi:hypothetical protein
MSCECGRRAAQAYIWNGRDHVPVCDECYVAPENIILEACVQYATDATAFNPPTLEEAFRVELGFREMPWTPTLQAYCDKLYCEWYLEGIAQ